LGGTKSTAINESRESPGGVKRIRESRKEKRHTTERVTLRLHYHRRFVGKSVERYLFLPQIAADCVIGNNDTAVSTEKARGTLRFTFVDKAKEH
jgi:hypothetical protein